MAPPPRSAVATRPSANREAAHAPRKRVTAVIAPSSRPGISRTIANKARAEAAGSSGYDGFCRDRAVSVDVPHVVRFRVPDEGATSWDDLIRGPITFEHRNLEDFVLRCNADLVKKAANLQ